MQRDRIEIGAASTSAAIAALRRIRRSGISSVVQRWPAIGVSDVEEVSLIGGHGWPDSRREPRSIQRARPVRVIARASSSASRRASVSP